MSTLPMFKHSFPVSKLSRPDGIGKKRIRKDVVSDYGLIFM